MRNENSLTTFEKLNIQDQGINLSYKNDEGEGISNNNDDDDGDD